VAFHLIGGQIETYSYHAVKRLMRGQHVTFLQNGIVLFAQVGVTVEGVFQIAGGYGTAIDVAYRSGNAVDDHIAVGIVLHVEVEDYERYVVGNGLDADLPDVAGGGEMVAGGAAEADPEEDQDNDEGCAEGYSEWFAH
jgi:hypothetical protein